MAFVLRIKHGSGALKIRDLRARGGARWLLGLPSSRRATEQPGTHIQPVIGACRPSSPNALRNPGRRINHSHSANDDTAWIYGTENHVGKTSVELGTYRSELVITSKIPGCADTKDFVNTDVKALGTDYIDLLEGDVFDLVVIIQEYEGLASEQTPSMASELPVPAYTHIEPVWGVYANHSLEDLQVYPEDILVHGGDYGAQGAVEGPRLYRDVGTEGARSLARMLERNSSITTLNLCGNVIGPEGSASVASASASNAVLEEINLYGSRLGAPGVKGIVAALDEHRTLRVLDLNGNTVGAAEQQIIRKMMLKSGVTTLDMCSKRRTRASPEHTWTGTLIPEAERTPPRASAAPGHVAHAHAQECSHPPDDEDGEISLGGMQQTGVLIFRESAPQCSQLHATTGCTGGADRVALVAGVFRADVGAAISESYFLDKLSEDKSYSSKCDLWSLGAVFAELLTGHPTFDMEQGTGDGYTKQIILREVLDVTPETIEARLSAVPQAARAFLRRIFERDLLQRPSAQEMLEDEYLRSVREELARPKEALCLDEIISRLRTHGAASKTTRASMLAMARSQTQLPWEQFCVLRTAFDLFDAHGGLRGCVDLKAFLAVVLPNGAQQGCVASREDARGIWTALCGDVHESLSYCEFLAALLPPIEDAFMDVDGPQYLRRGASRMCLSKPNEQWDPSLPVSRFLEFSNVRESKVEDMIFDEDMLVLDVVKRMWEAHFRWVIIRYKSGHHKIFDYIISNMHECISPCTWMRYQHAPLGCLHCAPHSPSPFFLVFFTYLYIFVAAAPFHSDLTSAFPAYCASH